ncbi:MAG: phosphatidylserine decarboxylase, partial [Deltaproteobacteria bacterium]|nr:phosphatidylserine decarboxylase [Deltaproteobacteria bacterium]
MNCYPHQYIERHSGRIRTEKLFGDHLIQWLYSPIRERADWLFQHLTGATASRTLAHFNFDMPLGGRTFGNRRFLEEVGVNLGECLDPAEQLNTARKVFERRIRYWDCRPMPKNPEVVVSPADARVLVGSLCEGNHYFIKEKFF